MEVVSRGGWTDRAANQSPKRSISCTRHHVLLKVWDDGTDNPPALGILVISDEIIS
jgi:hypothetical protein